MNGSDDRRSDLTARPAAAAAERPLVGNPEERIGQGAAGPAHPYYASAPGAPPPPQVQAPPRDPRAKSSVLAGFLSVMPGLGQVYVGYYVRGFVNAIVVAFVITLLASGGPEEALIPLLAIFLAFFWCYNIIDAIRRASLYNHYLAGGTGIELPQDFKMPKFGGSIVGGIALIVFGFILLLHTRWGMTLDWVEDWWPVAPILLGAYLLGKAVQEKLAQSADRHPKRREAGR